jgi:hypothetical protein
VIYVIRDSLSGHIKIGLSDKPWARLSKMQSDTPGVLEMVATFDGGLAEERALHARFSEQRHRGEWFTATGPCAEWVASLPKPERPAGPYRTRGALLQQLIDATGVPSHTAYMWILRDRFPSRHWMKLLDAGVLTQDELLERARRLGHVSVSA